MKPSSRRTSAMPRQTLVLRHTTVFALFWAALRMRVSMSEIGSLIAIVWSGVVGEGAGGGRGRGFVSGLPAGLAHARDLALEGELAEHDAADAELAVDAAGAPGQLAAAHDAAGELGGPVRLCDLCFGGHRGSLGRAGR